MTKKYKLKKFVFFKFEFCNPKTFKKKVLIKYNCYFGFSRENSLFFI